MKETKDVFDYRDNPSRRAKNRPGLFLNVLTSLVLIAVLCVVMIYWLVYNNPTIRFNPFPPPPSAPIKFTETITPTFVIRLVPTWTLTPLPLPTHTTEPSAVPTDTLVPSVSPLPKTPQPTSAGGMPYVLLQGDPKAIPNIGQLSAGCNWAGVAGQAFGMDTAPVVGLFVKLGGTWNGKTVDLLGMTGTATQYGMGGYEFTLGERPLASQGDLWVQLVDQAMLPLSEKIYFDTYADCNKNLILINFKQVR